MPADPLRFPYRNELNMPVVGLEAEFRVFIDEQEITFESALPHDSTDSKMLNSRRRIRKVLLLSQD